ncbi:ATP-binding protein [Floridanema evergladense]|uniref:histidine kinase n=1 Tax=Floridaenema evergladense BLCC-F167 TaxID=3153639 RepID=A0ABV4WUV3_9CYAN
MKFQSLPIYQATLLIRSPENWRKLIVKYKHIKVKIIKTLQRLQTKILLFTFGASLLPILFLLGATWEFVYQPLIDLEKTRLDDQMLAFRGYTSATAQGLQDVTKSFAYWSDFYEAIPQRKISWIKTEVVDSLLLSTSVNVVQVMNLRGEILAQQGEVLRSPILQEKIAAMIAQKKLVQELVTIEDRKLLILVAAPVTRTNRTGDPHGTLIIGQILDKAWLEKFLTFSQPTTKLKIISPKGKLIISLDTRNSNNLENQHLSLKELLPVIENRQSLYEIDRQTGLNTIYAPLNSRGHLVAIAKIQITSQYFQQAYLALTRLILIGLILAIILSIAVANLLAKQIGVPINQLAKRSRTLAAGDLNAPIPGIGAGGELGQLASAYQEMAESLNSLVINLEKRVEERTLELENARLTLEERVEQRTKELWQKNQELQTASEQLKQLNLQLTIKADQLTDALSSLKKAQAQLIQTEKMSSLGQLVAGVAHEINNPINFIHANLSYVSTYSQDLLNLVQIYHQRYNDPEIEKQIEEIELDFIMIDLPKIISSMQSGSDRISQIVLALRNFSRLDEAEMKLVNLHEGINSTLLILQNRLYLGEQFPAIQIIKQYGYLPLVECYPRQINQVFMNIITNAIDAIKEGLAKQLIEKSKTFTPTIIVQTQKLDPEWVKIRFWNNGPVIPPHVISRIFDPFFTTKPVGKGTGLGLSASYQIIDKHGGTIDVSSAAEQGTEFVILLPIKNIRN